MTKAYLLGALHDGTERTYTYRICQREQAYVEFLKMMILRLGARAWVYREGKSRNLYVVEFAKSLLREAKIASRRDKRDYVRGYFDAEGGIPQSSRARFYIYFAQKDRNDLETVRKYLIEIGIRCGRVHNPSVRADPNYWRFFVRCESYEKFAREIGSWHPRKAKLLRMVI